jgi:circadian clock protein KaiC
MVIDQIATRRLRIVKYRGSTHGTNEYPFLIDENGISVLPVTSLRLDHKALTGTMSTGLPALDKLFLKGGYFKGSSTLITGTAGTSKTILASYFALSGCRERERVLYFSFEESPDQLVRNMKSVGINLQSAINSKLLIVHSSRPSLQGLEMHLLLLHKLIKDIKPKTVIVDPISSLVTVGSSSEVRAMLVRLMDTLKTQQITALFTALTHPQGSDYNDLTVDAVSSLADTWIKVRNEEESGDRVRTLFIVKSRGMGHSNDLNNFTIGDKGIQLKKDNDTKVPIIKSSNKKAISKGRK